MTTGLGVLDMLGADETVSPEVARPVLPNMYDSFVELSRSKTRSLADEGWASAARSAQTTLEVAKRNAARGRTSTTLAALAHAYETVGDNESAVRVAEEVLTSLAHLRAGISDPFAARLAIEIMLRDGKVEEALRFAEQVSVSDNVKLVLASVLAAMDRYADAHGVMREVLSARRHAVSGYVLVREGKDVEAVGELRAALRLFPEDADSAHNLAIALWRLGSRRKAIAASLQATTVAPGREDISLSYFDFLISEHQHERVIREMSALFDAGVMGSSRLQYTYARAEFAAGNLEKSRRALEAALDRARAEKDVDAQLAIQGSIIKLKVSRGKISRDDALMALESLATSTTWSESLVMDFAQLASRASHSSSLIAAVSNLNGFSTRAVECFIRYQIANLSGDVDKSAEWSRAWLAVEPKNPHAVAAYLVSVGIGQSSWAEASETALKALRAWPDDHALVNNAAYVLAMYGLPKVAISALRELAQDDYVLEATLGLALLADGDLHAGMRHYRLAAMKLSKGRAESYCLMASYQALVVKQLGLAGSTDSMLLSSLSLPEVSLPRDWQDRPEYLRLKSLASRSGLEWPLVL